MANPGLLLRQQPDRRRAGGRRRAGRAVVVVRRGSVARRLETEWTLFLRVRAHVLVPVSPGSDHEDRHENLAGRPDGELRLLAVAETERRSRTFVPTRNRWRRCTSPNKKLTDMNAQTTNWTTSTLEVVSWKSQDGAAIEGVLHKPLDFDPARKYPLLVVIHGGPTGVSRAVPFTSATYPIDVWVPRRTSSCSSRTIAAAPATERSSERSTSAISASATPGTCCRASTR